MVCTKDVKNTTAANTSVSVSPTCTIRRVNNNSISAIAVCQTDEKRV